MLSTEKIGIFEKAMLAKKEQLAKELAAIEKPEDFGNDIDGLDEEADEAASFSNQVALGQSLKDRINEIDSALNRIETGEYGLCSKCNGMISEELLRVIPESSLCEICKKSER